MDPNYVVNIRYTGFEPYREHRIATKKPIQTNNYYKDYYNDLSYNKTRHVSYFDKEPRWKSTYDKVLLGSLDEVKKEDYNKKTLYPLIDYDFCHLPLDKSQISQTSKNEYHMKDRSCDQYKKIRSYYSTTNKNVMKSLESQSSKDLYYPKAIIPDIHVTRSRPFRSDVHESEYIYSFGKLNDNNKDKYFLSTKMPNGDNKPYSDYMKLAKGTNKFSHNPQGYLGYITKSDYDFKNTKENDAYSNQLKVNILGNIKEQIPGYQGYRKSDSVVDRKLNEKFFIDSNVNLK